MLCKFSRLSSLMRAWITVHAFSSVFVFVCVRWLGVSRSERVPACVLAPFVCLTVSY